MDGKKGLHQNNITIQEYINREKQRYIDILLI